MDARFVKGSPLPDLGGCCDLLHDVREMRLEVQKVTEALKERETEIQEHLIQTIPKSSTGVAGLHYRVQINVSKAPQCVDWPKLFETIERTGRFDLLQKRLAEGAVKEIWDAGFDIPGVAEVLVPKVSLTKIPGR